FGDGRTIRPYLRAAEKTLDPGRIGPAEGRRLLPRCLGLAGNGDGRSLGLFVAIRSKARYKRSTGSYKNLARAQTESAASERPQTTDARVVRLRKAWVYISLLSSLGNRFSRWGQYSGERE